MAVTVGFALEADKTKVKLTQTTILLPTKLVR